MKAPAVFFRRLAVPVVLLAAPSGPVALHAAPQAPVGTAAAQVQRVRVPQLVDRPLDAGRQALRRLGLVVGQETPVKSGATAGTILWQSIPRDSLVPLKTIVHLRYATPGTFDGPEVPVVDSSSVPDLTGHSRTSAVIALAIAKLSLGRVDSVPDDAHVGKVVRQDPAPGGRIPRDSRVAVWLGYAPLIDVPDLREETVDAASERLQRIGLLLGRIDSTKTPTGSGLILSQRPTAGSAVIRGTPIRVAIEVGPPARVPNLIGRTEAEAVRMIESAKLRVGVVDSVAADSSLGRIVAQSPAPDSAVWQSTRVGFRIAVQGRWVTVPPLIDSTPAVASRRLAAVGLVLGRIDSVPRPGGSGLITHQAPLPGTRAVRGDAVRVRVQVADSGIGAGTTGQESVPPPPRPPGTLTVPDVHDSTPEAARRTLEAAGFPGIRIDSVERAGGSGLVTFQLPRAGTVLTSAVGVELQVAIAPQEPDGGSDETDSDVSWVWIVGGLAGFGALALTARKLRDGRDRRKPRPDPEVSFQPHSQLAWQSAGGSDPVGGSDLLLVPGGSVAAVTFQGEP